MNEDMPWVIGLTDEEIQELRSKKQELTQYGKEKIRELMMNQEPYPDEMFEEAERRERSNRVLERYNDFYNTEVSGLTWGTHITPEFQQAMALECMLDALRCENLNHEFDMVQTADINALIEGLYQQGKDFLQKSETVMKEAQGHTRTDLDAL